MARVVIFSGAGISAESGISTFRDTGGLWEEYDVSVICNHDSLDKNEDLTIEFYDKRRADIKDKIPNRAHEVIAKLKKKYPDDIAVITQNVDNLFEKAGLDKDDVIHLHGFLPEIRCRDYSCNATFNIGYDELRTFEDGICPECGTKLRPNIVFFGEMAPLYEELHAQLQNCELIVVIGTSGNVIGVNEMAAYINISILNNLEPSHAINDSLFSKVIYDKASVAIDSIEVEIEQFLS